MFNIYKLTRFDPLVNILKMSSLRDYQVLNALRIALNSYHMILDSTGLGKTLSMIAGLQMRVNSGRSKKILWVAPLATIHQVALTLRNETDFRFSILQGNSETLKKFIRINPNLMDLILVNMEAFDNRYVLEIFKSFSIAQSFDTVVIDEVHLISKPFHSNRNAFIYMLAYRIPNVYLLTATPIISEVQQYATSIALMTKDLTNLFSIRNRIHRGEYKPELVPELVSLTLREEEYETQVHLIKTHLKVDYAPGISIFKYTRGESALDVNNELINIIQSYGEKPHFLIHCYLTEHHDFLKRFLESELKLRVGIVSGARTQQKEFNNGDLDCIIFSISTGLNLPSDFLIMYDWTTYIAQSIGRGLRTVEIGKYKVHFLITDCEKEIQLCKNSVIKNGYLTEKSLGFNPLKQLRREDICLDD